MASQAVGKLYIDIEARTAKLEEGFEKANRGLKDLKGKLENAGKGGLNLDALGLKFLKFNLYAQLSANAIQAVGRAIASVNNNAEMLGREGLITSRQVVAIQDAKVAWTELETTISKGWATIVQGGVFSTQVLGAMGDTLRDLAGKDRDIWSDRAMMLNPYLAGLVLASRRVTEHSEAMEKFGLYINPYTAALAGTADLLGMTAGKYSEVEKRAIAAAGGVAEYRKEVEALQGKRRAAEAEAEFQALTKQEKITRLLAIAERGRAIAQNANSSTVAKESALLVAAQAEAQANAMVRESQKQGLDLIRQQEVAQAKLGMTSLSYGERIASLQATINGLLSQGIVERARAGKATEEDVRRLMSMFDAQNQLVSAQTSYNAKLAESRALAAEYYKAMGSGAQAGLSDLDKLSQEALKLGNLQRSIAAEKMLRGEELSADEAKVAAELIATQEKVNQLTQTRSENLLRIVELERQAGEAAQFANTARERQVALLQGNAAGLRARAAMTTDSGDKLNLTREAAGYEVKAEQLGARYSAEDAEVLRKYFEVLDRGNAKALTDGEELRANQDEINLLLLRHGEILSSASTDRRTLTKEEIQDLNTLAELQARNIELTARQRQEWDAAGAVITNSLWDSIIAGEKFEDVLKNLASALAEYIMQQIVLKTIGNAIGGALGGMFGGGGGGGGAAGAVSGIFGAGGAALGGKASGGPVTPGTTYEVNERGQEFFTPSTYGYITPAERTGGGAAGSVSFSTSYNIAAGVTANELRPILEQHAKLVREQTKQSIMSDLARGGRRAALYGG